MVGSDDGQRGHRVQMADKCAHTFACVWSPHFDRIVGRSTGQQKSTAISNQDSKRRDRIRVTEERAHTLAVVQRPDLHGLVGRGARQLVFGGQLLDGGDPLLVAAQRVVAFAAGRVHDLDRVGRRAQGQCMNKTARVRRTAHNYRDDD